MDRPFLSIVIPCRNRPREIAELLAQIEQMSRESGHSVEVIVVDDGSCSPLALTLQLQFPDASFIRSEIRRGAPHARRIGLAWAHGEVVHFHDSDDLLGQGWIEGVIDGFKSDPDLDLLITSRTVQSAPNSPLKLVHPRIASRLAPELAKLRHYQLFQNAIGPLGGVTFRRRTIEPADIADAAASQDWLMYDAALVRAGKVTVRDDLNFVFRTFGGDRLSGSAHRRVKGFVFAARRRFIGRRAQRLATILYCASAGDGVARVVNVRCRSIWRAACRLLALSRPIARLAMRLHPRAGTTSPA